MTINNTNENPIEYIKGDLFDSLVDETDNIILPHICNDIGTMGAGFVVPLNRHFPGIRQIYQEWHGGNKIARSATPENSPLYMLEYSGNSFGNDDMKLGSVQFVSSPIKPKITVANMIGQSDVVSRVPVSSDVLIRPPIRYGALRRAMRHVVNFAENYNIKKIWAPKFGSGLAGGDWDIVKEIITEELEGCDVTIVEFDQG